LSEKVNFQLEVSENKVAIFSPIKIQGPQTKNRWPWRC